MRGLTRILACLTETIYPEFCLLCGAHPQETAWSGRGPRVTGLRPWDAPHLCRSCGQGRGPQLVTGFVERGTQVPLPVFAAANTGPDLVKLVGQFKYHGVRGLAWPLARRLSLPLSAARAACRSGLILVPVPLHRRRQRRRGFNQAEILARLAAAASGVPVRNDILVRRRPTRQQAKMTTVKQRQQNLARAFRSEFSQMRAPAGAGLLWEIILVDDLVTSGCTALAAAVALERSGHEVRGILTLGLAATGEITGPRVDTWEGGF